MSTTFSAQEPALGYYYQIIRGLLLLLNEDRLENPWLSFECMDDISIETPEETDLYQTKLHVTKAQLTDRSTDFWRPSEFGARELVMGYICRNERYLRLLLQQIARLRLSLANLVAKMKKT